MCLKKNKISYLAWIILMLFSGAGCAFFSMLFAELAGINMVVSAIIIVTAYYGIGFLIYYATGKFCYKIPNLKITPMMQNVIKPLETILIIVLVCIAFAIRAFLISEAGEEAAYYEVAKVGTKEDGSLLQTVQNSVYFYCVLLRGLYLIVGNNWIAGIWLQIVLQIAGAVVFYFGLKKCVNQYTALFVYAFILFTPFAISRGLTYSPQILFFFLYALVFYLLADFMERSKNEISSVSVGWWIYIVALGIGVGFLNYVDICGLTIYILLLCIPFFRRKYYTEFWKTATLLILLISIGFFVLMMGIDSLLTGSSLGDVFRAWTQIYGVKHFSFDVLLYDLRPEFIILVALSCLGCFSFWRKEKTENFTPFVFMSFVTLLMVLFNITTTNMNGSYLLHILLAVLSAISTGEFYDKNIVNIEKEMNVEKEVEIMENTQTQQNVELIRNPLPLPKKHAHKAMDYSFQPSKNQMKYDIFVSDDDDFDLK